jgi:hypothetical protein
VIDDRVEADLGQRVAQLGRGAVERPGFAREIGPEIDDRNRISVGHDFCSQPLNFNVFEARVAPVSFFEGAERRATCQTPCERSCLRRE